MNAIKYAIDRIMETDIPRPILAVTFLSRFANPNDPTMYTIASKLQEKIIYNRVITDMELTYSTMVTIPLSQCTRVQGDTYSSIWHIPKSLTQGKSIISVSEIANSSGSIIVADGINSFAGMPGVTSPYQLGYGPTGAIVGASNQLLNSVSPIPNISNALVYLISDNTILIKDAALSPASMHVRAFVEMDEGLNHLQRAYYPVFYELVLLATQAYIYNNVTLEQDNAFISSGGELNKFKEIVDGFSDASELYKEKLAEWPASALLNDPESQRQFYQQTVGAGW